MPRKIADELATVLKHGMRTDEPVQANGGEGTAVPAEQPRADLTRSRCYLQHARRYPRRRRRAFGTG
jgi:hypothetical protein